MTHLVETVAQCDRDAIEAAAKAMFEASDPVANWARWEDDYVQSADKSIAPISHADVYRKAAGVAFQAFAAHRRAAIAAVFDALKTPSYIENIARALCEFDGGDPDSIEPGNVIIYPSDNKDKWESVDGVFLDALADNGTRLPDGITRQGEKGHFYWRRYIWCAQVAQKAMLAKAREEMLNDAAQTA